MVVLDTTFLSLIFNPRSPAVTRLPIPAADAQARLKAFVHRLDVKREPVVVPTPALAELLVGLSDSVGPVVDRLTKAGPFKLAPFDMRAAVELAAMTRSDVAGGDKRGGVDAPWQKVKYDRQIVAIAASLNARAICSDDRGVRAFGLRAGLEVIGVADLPEVAPREVDLFAGVDDEED